MDAHYFLNKCRLVKKGRLQKKTLTFFGKEVILFLLHDVVSQPQDRLLLELMTIKPR